MRAPAVVATLVASFAFAVPLAASATCITTCKAALMFPTCAEPSPQDKWPSGKPLTFTSACETCCAAPGGPLVCTPAAPELSAFSLWTGEIQASGSFAPKDVTCEEEALFGFGGVLAPGSWQLRSGNLILLFFEIGAAGGCKTDADCTGCEECDTGTCATPTCKPTCKSDAECGGGQCVESVPGCCAQCQAKPEADAGDAGGADSVGAADAGAADSSAPGADAGGQDATSTVKTDGLESLETSLSDAVQANDAAAPADAGTGGTGGSDAATADAPKSSAPAGGAASASSGCAATQGSGSPASAACLLLGLAALAVRTRRSTRDVRRSAPQDLHKVFAPRRVGKGPLALAAQVDSAGAVYLEPTR